MRVGRGKQVTIFALVLFFTGLTLIWLSLGSPAKISERVAGLLGFADEAMGAEEAEFWCPMHPQIKRTNANEVCPICNMALVPLEKGTASESEAGLVLTARQVQQAGVVTEVVRRRALQREFDAPGRLDYDERLLRHITCWVKGKSRIDKLYVHFTGDYVAKNQLLAEIYSPELISAQEELLIALSEPSGRRLLADAKKKLEYWGMRPEQVEELIERRQIRPRIPIPAPIQGTVIKPAVREGDYVNEGDVLFHLADLSRLWLFADVFEEDLPYLALGEEVTFELRSRPGESFRGKVAFIEPIVQAESRTIRVRIDVRNERIAEPTSSSVPPSWKLKPGMYGRVRFTGNILPVVAVPENAVLWSGRRRVVIVKESEGVFRPREIRLGRQWLHASGSNRTKQEERNDFGFASKRFHEVAAGLVPGEEVVTAGAFLLNAESQFQNVLAKMLPAASESATLENVIGPTLAKAIRNVLDAYYRVSAALADDDIKAAADHATALARAASALRKDAESERNRPLADAALVLISRSDAVRKAKNPREARFAFGRLSRDLIQLLADHGGKTLFGKELFLFRCGMSQVGYENWLWFSEEKLNPYMGRKRDQGKMLT